MGKPRRRWRDQRGERIRSVIRDITLVAAAVLALLALYTQSQQGVKARRTQCDREPLTRKVARTAYAVREQLPPELRITREELDRFLRQAPRNCPAK